MKNFYYFSNTKLKFVEIRNFYKKFVFLIAFFAFISSFFIFSAYFVAKQILNHNSEVSDMQAENRDLRNKIEQYSLDFKNFNEKLQSITESSNDLRLLTNLQPITNEERDLGTGGSIFDNFNPSNSSDVKSLLDNLDTYSEKVSLKMDFELNNFSEIKKKLDKNLKLFDAIPAINPTTGAIGDKFGMRMHPILKVKKLHSGLDIVANTGTKVFAPGGGKVDFVGYRGGYGLTVEIDHGFGYRTIYAHLKKALVKNGTKVKRGDEIALSGQSGQLATGPHLHYEVRHNGIALNPRNFIYDDVNLFDIVEAESETEK